MITGRKQVTGSNDSPLHEPRGYRYAIDFNHAGFRTPFIYTATSLYDAIVRMNYDIFDANIYEQAPDGTVTEINFGRLIERRTDEWWENK